MSTSIVNILVNLRSVVGEVAFNAAIEAIQSGKVPLAAAPGEKPSKKERKQVELAPEKAAERAANMAALQAWIAKVRSEMPEGTSFRDAQKAAGESWKAMSDEQKAAWKEQHPLKSQEAEEGEVVEPKPAKVVVVGAGAATVAKEPKQVVTVAKADEPAASSEPAPKKAGRPKKAAAAEQKADE